MKNILTCIILFSALPVSRSGEWKAPSQLTVSPSENVFIITIDGVRWQEIFNGANASLISNPETTPDTATMKMLYWEDDPELRRRKLLPFLWNVVVRKGQLYGNRNFNNKVNAANLYGFSYPGYNEIFTGGTDITVSSNNKKMNENRNVFEFLDQKPGFEDKVVAFTSWDVFPYILNEKRNGLMINSGYEDMEGNISDTHELINTVQSKVAHKGETRYDQLTFLTAREYMQQHKPRVVFIGLGETDEYAHLGRYDLYLEQMNKIDRMIAELWHWAQTTPGYKDNTSFLITTDHGRGSRNSKWTSHSTFIRGSSQTWMALMGPGIEPLGEMKQGQQLYQYQIAGMIAALAGEKFN